MGGRRKPTRADPQSKARQPNAAPQVQNPPCRTVPPPASSAPGARPVHSALALAPHQMPCQWPSANGSPSANVHFSAPPVQYEQALAQHHYQQAQQHAAAAALHQAHQLHHHQHQLQQQQLQQQAAALPPSRPMPQPFADWAVPRDRYQIRQLIGTGSYGRVCEAVDLQTNAVVAIKRIHRVFDDLVDCKRILREAALLRRLAHPGVVGLLDICAPQDPRHFDEVYMVLEISDSDLKKLFRTQVHLSELHVKTLLYNMLAGLRFVHSAGVLHRDLKPANCLVNQDCSVKICDFGLARTVDSTYYDPAEMTHTHAHMHTPGSPSPGDDTQHHRDLGGATSPGRLTSGAYGHVNAQASYSASASTAVSSIHVSPEQQRALVAGHSGTVPDSTVQAAAAALIQQRQTHAHRSPPMASATSSGLKRQLTGHVVTRWYRAPELILLQGDYSEKIDVWSAGCIFAELLGMMVENVANPLDRGPLFPGGSCFPLSPDQKHPHDYRFHSRSAREQLNVIFNLLGTPSQREAGGVLKEDARRYLDVFAPRPPANLTAHFPGASESALDLLRRMLAFDPRRRASVEEALWHPFLAEVRNPAIESVAERPVQMLFDDWEALDATQLRYHFLKEIRYFHPEVDPDAALH